MRAASDVGGTFTDLVYYDDTEKTANSGKIRTLKTNTTPPDFEEGVLNGIDKAKISLEDIHFFAHGSTVIINTLTERKGAKTALITTQGFRDVLEISRGNRPDLFNLNSRKPKPFVERYLRLELRERTNYQGEILQSVDMEPLEKMLSFLKQEKVEAIAVSFLHAYANPENEIKTVKEIHRLWPEISVLASHGISQEWREYERTNTTVLSAYVHPVAKSYIEALEQKVKNRGLKRAPYFMQSNCGISTVEMAKSNPISLLESGPASGIHAGAYLGKKIGEENIIVLDIGGTTAKCALIDKGAITITTRYSIEKNRETPGYPVQTPVCEIVEIGNGGGSIAWLDPGGKLHIGPKSAGAIPGPAAYGKGGTQPTVTDANLVLGRIDKTCFVGGEITPDFQAVQKAFQPLMDKMSLSLEEVARGILRLSNANMVNALRLISTNKGYDPRDFSLMACGGGGALHAIALAEELKIPRVIIPAYAAVFSAWGMLLTDLRQDFLQTRLTRVCSQTLPETIRQFQRMEHQAESHFKEEITEEQPLQYEYFLDMRYVGQEHTVKVPLPAHFKQHTDLKSLCESFHTLHKKRYTFRLETGIEIVNYHLTAKHIVPKPEITRKKRTGRTIDQIFLHEREVDFDQYGRQKCSVYNGLLVEPGMVITGPCILQEPSSTLVIPPKYRAKIDPYGNIHIALETERG